MANSWSILVGNGKSVIDIYYSLFIRQVALEKFELHSKLIGRKFIQN